MDFMSCTTKLSKSIDLSVGGSLNLAHVLEVGLC